MSFKALSRGSDNNILLPTKSKRSQSALEYMMTYGWAILIIVIVAVILYSMGIFNPSSSITFTSSGFSPFTVSSSLCNNLGYKIAVLAGPIPNNANSLQIDKVYLTSATGANATTAAYTLTNPVTLKSGQSATILIPNVACNAANIHYSISANIQYSYTASTLGLQTVNTTGTVAGTSIVGKPSVLTSYEPVTITNSQSSATPNPFQQMVVFNSTDPGFSSIATGNFGQNVEFFYYNGTVVPSWLENYTADNATWWLKIAAIPADSSETVYVGFASTSTNLFNTVNDGEAPQLSCSNPSDTASCSTYAEYDDGANVFTDYWNFVGTSIPSGWFASSFNGYINNGVYLDNSNWGGLLTNNKYNISLNADSFIVGFYLNSTGNTNMAIGTDGFVRYAGGGNPYSLDWGLGSVGSISGDLNYLNYFTGTDQYINSSAGYIIGKNLQTGQIIKGEISNTVGYLHQLSIRSDSPNTMAYISVMGVFTTPPNGVMPSVGFGSVA